MNELQLPLTFTARTVTQHTLRQLRSLPSGRHHGRCTDGFGHGDSVARRVSGWIRLVSQSLRPQQKEEEEQPATRSRHGGSSCSASCLGCLKFQISWLGCSYLGCSFVSWLQVYMKACMCWIAAGTRRIAGGAPGIASIFSSHSKLKNGNELIRQQVFQRQVLPIQTFEPCPFSLTLTVAPFPCRHFMAALAAQKQILAFWFQGFQPGQVHPLRAHRLHLLTHVQYPLPHSPAHPTIHSLPNTQSHSPAC